jgi:hypothetical protein
MYRLHVFVDLMLPKSCKFYSSLLLQFRNINHTKQSFYWEADSHSVGQEIARLLCNQKFRTVHKSSSLGPVLSQLNSIHALTHYFVSIHFSIFLQATPGHGPTS